MSKQRLYGLLGHPLTHSFSAKYFNEKFKDENLPCTYENFDLTELPDLKTFIESKSNLVGLNVTIPYKMEIIEKLDSVDSEARMIGAVNVIQIRNGRLKGFNTDYIAFMQSVSPLIDPSVTKALILGLGGASKAVKHALKKWNIEYSVVSRKKDKGDLIYEEINSKILGSHNLIINTTPLGTHPNVHELPEIPYELLNKNHVLYDLTYNPESTEFMKQGIKKGCRVKNGYDMLVRQAELSWEIWNQ